MSNGDIPRHTTTNLDSTYSDAVFFRTDVLFIDVAHNPPVISFALLFFPVYLIIVANDKIAAEPPANRDVPHANAVVTSRDTTFGIGVRVGGVGGGGLTSFLRRCLILFFGFLDRRGLL